MESVRKMKLLSNNIGYGPRPDPDDEVLQWLAISSDGYSELTVFRYADGEHYRRTRRNERHLPPELAQRVLSLIAEYFTQNTVRFDVTDVGSWTLTLTDKDGVEKEYQGPLCNGYELNGQNLSQVLREALEMPDLIAFDDCGEDCIINRITLDYHRVTKMEAGPAFGPEIDFITLETTERLLIDRATDTVEIYRKIGEGMEIRHSYHIQEGIGSFLNRYDDELFRAVPNAPAEAEENPLDIRNYVISVEFDGGKRIERSGYYDKFGVPLDLEYFLEGLSGFICFYGGAEIFNADLFKRSNRVKEPQLIFCSCAFQRGGRTYYYLTEDETLEAGDFVWVPVGNHDREKVVRIEMIERCDEEEPLFDPYDTKHILRRCEEDEIPQEWTAFDPPTFLCPLIEREVTPEECRRICSVVKGNADQSILEELDPPMEVDLVKELKCWNCDNPWSGN